MLDVGCGPGSTTIELARMVPQGSVVGLDVYVKTLEQTRASANDAGVSNIEFVQGDARSVPGFTDGNSMSCKRTWSLMHLSDSVAALRERRRLVKTGWFKAAGDGLLTIQWPEYETFSRQKGSHERIA